MDGTREHPVKASGRHWGRPGEFTSPCCLGVTRPMTCGNIETVLSSPIVTHSSFGMKLLDRLRDEQRITAAAYESIYHRTKRSGESVQELIIDTGAMS